MNKKINKETLSVPSIFQKKDEHIVGDTRFTKVKIWLMHTGENENGSCFDKQYIEKAIPTLANTPILGYVEDNRRGDKDFSDHRRGFVTKDGERKFVYLGSSYGVIPETNNAHFEMRLCDDGIEREFLVVDGLLWNKLEDGVDILSKTGFKSQSMELDDEDYDGYFDENGIFHFTHFVFYGACMLGMDVEPAMTNSTVEMSFCKSLKEEIKNKLEMFNEYTKGGNVVEETQKVTETEVTEITETQVTEVSETEVVEVSEKVEVEYTVETEVEQKEEVQEVEAVEETETEIQPKEEKEVEVTEVTETEVEEIKEDSSKAELEALKEQHETLKTEYAKLEEMVRELTEYKNSRIKQDRLQEEKALFEKYDCDLTGVAEYEALKTRTTEFATITDLEKEIALLFTRNAKLQFSKEKESTRAYFEDTQKVVNSRYGYLTEKYKA